MEKEYTSRTFVKIAGGGCIPLLLPWIPPFISYRNHQKSLAHFSYLAPLILFFFTKERSQNEREEHGPMASP